MKIYGKYIGREIDLDELEREDGLSIIPHKTLEALADEFDVQFSYDVVFASGYNFVFKCVATCELLNRRTEQIGEANKSNLTNDISRSYPAVMASKRAFDRAMIRIFGFEESYSDTEIEANSVKRKPSKEAVAKPTIAEPVVTSVEEALTVPEMPKPTEPVILPTEDDFTDFIAEDCEPAKLEDFASICEPDFEEDILPAIEDEPAIDEDITSEALSEKSVEEDVVENTDFLNSIIHVGRAKGKTMIEAYRKNREALEWVATNEINGDLFEEQRQLARKTIEYMNKKGEK